MEKINALKNLLGLAILKVIFSNWKKNPTLIKKNSSSKMKFWLDFENFFAILFSILARPTTDNFRKYWIFFWLFTKIYVVARVLCLKNHTKSPKIQNFPSQVVLGFGVTFFTKNYVVEWVFLGFLSYIYLPHLVKNCIFWERSKRL